MVQARPITKVVCVVVRVTAEEVSSSLQRFLVHKLHDDFKFLKINFTKFAFFCNAKFQHFKPLGIFDFWQLRTRPLYSSTTFRVGNASFQKHAKAPHYNKLLTLCKPRKRTTILCKLHQLCLKLNGQFTSSHLYMFLFIKYVLVFM